MNFSFFSQLVIFILIGCNFALAHNQNRIYHCIEEFPLVYDKKANPNSIKHLDISIYETNNSIDNRPHLIAQGTYVNHKYQTKLFSIPVAGIPELIGVNLYNAYFVGTHQTAEEPRLQISLWSRPSLAGSARAHISIDNQSSLYGDKITLITGLECETPIESVYVTKSRFSLTRLAPTIMK
jgi:hypothetical protein